MDHHHGDLVRLVGTDQEQVGAFERLLGPQQARPAIMIEIGPRPHVGQRRGEVGLESELIGLGTDRPILHRIDELESALARLIEVDVGIAQP